MTSWVSWPSRSARKSSSSVITRQVSPYAIGQRGERIHALIDEILREIPNKQLYDGKTSVYDLARQSFGATIRLVEHFRCVPDIIQFSNQLCYGGD